MAIIVEEQKRASLNFIQIIGWTAIILILCLAVYYIFFSTPELVTIPAPAGLAEVAPLTQATLHPEDVLNSPAFQALQASSIPLPTPTGPAPVGRSDPFIAP